MMMTMIGRSMLLYPPCSFLIFLFDALAMQASAQIALRYFPPF